MTTVEPTNLRPLTATLIARYAERFNAAFADGEHAATSPLGAWLLLALVASAAEGDARARLEDVLGTTADDARERATALLATPHPAVGLASGLWARRELLTTAYDRFADSLPEVVARGGVPTQPELDEWANRHSLGLIEHFPLTITHETAIVLANALATDVEWEHAFDVVPSDDWRRQYTARRMTSPSSSSIDPCARAAGHCSRCPSATATRGTLSRRTSCIQKRPRSARRCSRHGKRRTDTAS